MNIIIPIKVGECPFCLGKGKLTHNSFYLSVTASCFMCGGSGKLHERMDKIVFSTKPPDNIVDNP